MKLGTRIALVVALIAAACCAKVASADEATLATPSPATTAAVQDNCTRPLPQANPFGIAGLSGWDLMSHEDFLGNRASEHQHNINCTWNIPKPTPDRILLIKIISLQLEHEVSCSFDSLRLQYVEFNSTAAKNLSFCGTVDNKTLMSQSDVNINFKTDGSVNYRGFHLQWAYVNSSMATMIQRQNPIQDNSSSTLCRNIEDLDEVTVAGITASGGRLLSHSDFSVAENDGPPYGLRGAYKNNMNCQWTVTLTTKYILVWIEELQLEYSPTSRICNYDNLTLNFSNAMTGRLESLTFCFVTRNALFLANSSVTLKFISDSSVGSQGFHIKWMHLNESQGLAVIQSWSILTNSADANCTRVEPLSSQTLDDVGSYPGGRLVSHAEFLTALNSSYHPNMNCNWTISPPNNATIIHLKILTLELESGSHRLAVCRFDNLTFTFRNVINNRWEQKVVCSSLHSVKFTSSDAITIQFATDHSISMRGFHLVWYFLPRQDIVRLPEIEDLMSVNCPEVNEQGGTLSIFNYQPNSHCAWHWLVSEGERMEFKLHAASLDFRDYSYSRNSSRFAPEIWCSSGRDKLTFEYFNFAGQTARQTYCGGAYSEATFAAYSGPVDLTFVSDNEIQGRGFSLSYRRLSQDAMRSDCSAIRVVTRHQSKLEDQLSGGTHRTCRWTIDPIDENHLIKVTVNRFESAANFPRPPAHWPGEHRDSSSPYIIGRERIVPFSSYCLGKLTIRANRTLSEAALMSVADQVYSSGSRDINSYLTQSERVICSSRYTYARPAIFSVGSVDVQVELSPRSSVVNLDIFIDHIPFVQRGSGNLCPAPKVIDSKQSLVAKYSQSRVVSVKQQMVTSDGDCRTSVRFDTRPLSAWTSAQYQRGHKLMVTVNCSLTNGNLFVVADGTVVPVACNTVAQLNWTHQSNPIILEAVGTGGFSAMLEQLKWINDGGFRCPQYAPTKQGRSWIETLPLVMDYSGSYLTQDVAFYCVIVLSPPPGYDLMVQLQMQFSSELLEQFCSQFSTVLSHQPQLDFIISAPNRDDATLSLCNPRMSDSKLRVSPGGSLTVDLTAVRQLPWTQNRNSSGLVRSLLSGVDVLIVVNQVETCPTSNDFKNSWKASPDRSAVQNIVTVNANNSQTDCKIQIDASVAVRIATETGIDRPNEGDDGTGGACWSLQLVLDKFATTCGLNQLMLTVSNWDPMTESIVHRQREVCGNSKFSFRMPFEKQANSDIGMSLYYSGVRSGFVAEYSLSACQNALQTLPDMTNQLVSNGALGSPPRAPLVVAVLLLALCNLCVILFALRSQILTRARRLINRASGSQRLSYSTGGEGVALIDDS